MFNFIINQRDQLSFINTNFEQIFLLTCEDVINSYMPNNHSFVHIHICSITNF